MTEDIRIFSYLPNPRVWKSLITAKLAEVEVKVMGDKPRNLPKWLWDFDAKKLEDVDSNELVKFKRESKRGFKGDLYKTNEFLDKHPFGTVPAGFNSDGTVGIFESNSIMRAVARASNNHNLYGGKDKLTQSRIDSFLDANLVFAREFQVYVLELVELNDYLYKRMTSVYLFYLDGIEKALTDDSYIVGNELSIADISFVCDIAQFLRERDSEEIINSQGYEIISKNFEEEFPRVYKHLIKLCQKQEFKDVMHDYLDKALAYKK